MRTVAYWAFILFGLLFLASSAASADEGGPRGREVPYVDPHDWIMQNPDFLIPGSGVHCCGMGEHCRKAPPGSVTTLPGGGYSVTAQPRWFDVDRKFTQEQTYAAEDGQFWICAQSSRAVCLFVPPLGF